MMEISEIKNNIKIKKINKISKNDLLLIYSDYKKIEKNAFVTKKNIILKKIKSK